MAALPDTIYFYSDKDAYGEFSNFYPCKLVYNEQKYPTSEHAYQAAKFNYPGASAKSLEYAKIIAGTSTATKAFFLARQKRLSGYKWKTDLNSMIEQYQDVPLRPNWESVKVEVMREILRIKFSQDKFRSLLLLTQEARLVEHTVRDSFWADGGGLDISGKMKGLNMLGRLLMELREEINCYYLKM